MASTIAALTSGAGGISMTGDASGILNLNSNGTTVASVSSTGMAVTGTLSATGAVTLTTALPVLQGGTGVTTSTGTGSVVLSASPTFTGNVTTPLSYVRLNTANGYGSTNTKIRRFTNIVNNVGTDITYADSATLGGTFTINTTGVYSVNYSDQLTTAIEMGVSINSTQLTTSIYLINVADILTCSTTPMNSYASTSSAIFYAASGAVIRAHTTGGTTGGQPNMCQFTIARVQ
jgi:hypothetical protein